MKIIVDSREQNPLEFEHTLITGVIRKKLDVGDYGVCFEDGHSPPIVFERKSIEDLYGTLSAGYKRFKREIIRAQESKIQIIIIVEASITEIKKGITYSTREGHSILQQLFTLLVRHGLWTVFCSSRQEASDYIINFFAGVGREHVRIKNEK